jgi:hypothetical protein
MAAVSGVVVFAICGARAEHWAVRHAAKAAV